MRAALRIVLAFLAAVVAPCVMAMVPAAIYFVANGVGPDDRAWRLFAFLLEGVLMTASIGVLVLGVPTFLLLRWRELVRWWSTTLAGFSVACVAALVLEWPVGGESTGSQWNGQRMVFTKIHGVPTLEGWLAYLEQAAAAGTYGAVAGLAFWVVWRSLAPRQRVAA